MRKKRLAWKLTIAVVILTAALLFVMAMREPYSLCAKLAVREVFWPSAAESIPLSFSCVETREVVPDDVRQVIEAQKVAYNLVLQNVKTCRTLVHVPQREPDFTTMAFTQDTRRTWLPAYIGCCTYRLRRHFAVVLTKPDSTGAMVVIANLIQRRWAYLRFLRLHCDEQLRAWL